MNHLLEFSEAQLCELWLQHTSLEDDPRDVNKDLRVSFEDDDGLRQELTVAQDLAQDDGRASGQAGGERARFERARPAHESAWSPWTRMA